MGNTDEDIPQNFFEDRSRIIAIALFFAGLFVLAVGIGLVFFRTSTKNSDIELISSSPKSEVAGDRNTGEITVDVDGAVAKPGLYKLAGDLRVNDLIGKAGGLLSTADRSQINLAGKMVDGQKIHIPAVGEAPVTGFGKLNPTLVSINNATEAELDSLPQVGLATAAKIIGGRPYEKIEDLISKKVVSKSVFDKIKDKVGL